MSLFAFTTQRGAVTVLCILTVPSDRTKGMGEKKKNGVGFQQVPPGLVVNSMDNIVAARSLFQNMNPRELQVVFQDVNQRLNFQRHGMFVPERLGQARSEPDMPTFVRRESRDVLPLVARDYHRKEEERDVFSRSESPPQSNHETWRSREEEILGMKSVSSRISFLGKSGICRFRSRNRPSGEMADAANLGKLNEGSTI